MKDPSETPPPTTASFEAWASAVSLPLALLDREGVILALNAAFRRCVGGAVGQSLFELSAPPHEPLVRFLEAARRTRTPLPGRFVAARGGPPLGCEACLTASAESSPAAAPTLLMLDGAARSILPFDQLTERLEVLERHQALRRRAENELSFARIKLAAMLEHSPNPVSVKDAAGRYTLVNPMFCEMVALAPTRILGRTDAQILDAERAARAEQADREVLERGATEEHEEQWTVAGQARSFLAVAFPIEDPAADDRSVGRVYTDLTEERAAAAERLELETRLLHAQKLESLGVLAGGIAHDFNNLLMGVLGNASMAREVLEESPDEAAECLADIETTARRAADLCRQLLGYAGKGKFVVRDLDVSAMVTETVKLLSVALEKSATFALELDPAPPLTRADGSQLQQVLMNLVTNASEALGGKPGRITITTGSQECSAEYLTAGFETFELAPGRYVFLEVSDTGSGMDRELSERIFEPFFSTKFTGRGLGLAAVQGIVRSHAGGLRVYSEPGRGSTFRVLLPASTQVAASVPPPEPRRAAPQRGVVLVIDDERMVRRVARRLLHKGGFAVVEAEDGVAALELFRADPKRFRAVLLDMTMPRMSGHEVFRSLRQIDGDVRVVLSSGYNEQEVTSLLVGRGHASFLQKPYDAAQLLAALASVTGEA